MNHPALTSPPPEHGDPPGPDFRAPAPRLLPRGRGPTARRGGTGRPTKPAPGGAGGRAALGGGDAAVGGGRALLGGEEKVLPQPCCCLACPFLPPPHPVRSGGRWRGRPRGVGPAAGGSGSETLRRGPAWGGRAPLRGTGKVSRGRRPPTPPAPGPAAMAPARRRGASSGRPPPAVRVAAAAGGRADPGRRASSGRQ